MAVRARAAEGREGSWTLNAQRSAHSLWLRLRTLRETGRGGVATVNMVETSAFFFAFAIGEGNAKSADRCRRARCCDRGSQRPLAS